MEFTKRPILMLLFTSIAFMAMMIFGLVSNEHVQVSIFGKTLEPKTASLLASIVRIDPEAYDSDGSNPFARVGKIGRWSYCDYLMPENAKYDVALISASVSEGVVAGEEVTIDFTFKNTGNTRLFSKTAECKDFEVFAVGTQKTMDRASVFGDSNHAVSGWEAANRLIMEEPYADPEEAFHVKVVSKAPSTVENNVYREFFQGLIEGQGWLGESFGIDVVVGTPTESMKDNIQYVQDLSVDAQSLEGKERNLEATITGQTMKVKFGDLVVWTMRMSSGHYETPTPRGSYRISEKQELRVGGAAPHYRMPWFQMFKSGGYGIHGLPYLGLKRGAFWKEAENHIGIPVSHGCIRTLDKDAETLYRFTRIGTPIKVI